MAIVAPRRPNSKAIALPIPREPPVISAIFPERSLLEPADLLLDILDSFKTSQAVLNGHSAVDTNYVAGDVLGFVGS